MYFMKPVIILKLYGKIRRSIYISHIVEILLALEKIPNMGKGGQAYEA